MLNFELLGLGQRAAAVDGRTAAAAAARSRASPAPVRPSSLPLSLSPPTVRRGGAARNSPTLQRRRRRVMATEKKRGRQEIPAQRPGRAGWQIGAAGRGGEGST